MANRSTKAENTEDTAPAAPANSEPMNLDPEQSKAALAAWRGLYHFFGARVSDWVIADDGVIAEGFTVNGQYDPTRLLNDISRRNRRVELFPAIKYLNGEEPEPFTDSQDMTNFMVSYFKGSVEENTSKSPEYVRSAVKAYKVEHNLKTRRGPRKKVIRLDSITPENVEEVLKDVPSEQLEQLLSLIQGKVASGEIS